jgi:hypothetical protein
MKKKIAVLLVVFLLGGSALWADSLSFWGGLTFVVVGSAMAVTPVAFIGGDVSAPGSLVIEGLGLGFIIGGIIWMIAGPGDDSDSDSHAMLKENPILEHVSFGTTGEQTYIGVHFNY